MNSEKEYELCEDSLERLKAEQRRRLLLAGALSPEVLDAMEELLGVKGVIVTYQTDEQGNYDVYGSLRLRTLCEAMAVLRYEVGRVASVDDTINQLENHLCQKN